MSKKKSDEELHEAAQVTGEDERSFEAMEQLLQEPGMEEQLQDALDEAADLRDKVLRVAAEFDNFKKRMERERAAMFKYAGENIFRELLPVVDNLERAVDQGVIDGVDAQKNLESLLEGVKLTLRSLVSVLEKFEVKPVTAVGKPFDPIMQEALSMEASDVVPANYVVGEFEKGYYYKDRLLRAARVIVSSGSQDK